MCLAGARAFGRHSDDIRSHSTGHPGHSRCAAHPIVLSPERFAPVHSRPGVAFARAFGRHSEGIRGHSQGFPGHSAFMAHPDMVFPQRFAPMQSLPAGENSLIIILEKRRGVNSLARQVHESRVPVRVSAATGPSRILLGVSA